MHRMFCEKEQKRVSEKWGLVVKMVHGNKSSGEVQEYQMVIIDGINKTMVSFKTSR